MLNFLNEKKMDVYVIWPYQLAERNFVNFFSDDIVLLEPIKCEILAPKKKGKCRHAVKVVVQNQNQTI